MKKIILALAAALAVQFLVVGIATAQTQSVRLYWDADTDPTRIGFGLVWWEVTLPGGGGASSESVIAVPGADTRTAEITIPAAPRTIMVNAVAYGLGTGGITLTSGRSNTVCFGPLCPPTSSTTPPLPPRNFRIAGGS